MQYTNNEILNLNQHEMEKYIDLIFISFPDKVLKPDNISNDEFKSRIINTIKSNKIDNYKIFFN